jgi:hypothetical protein
MRNVKIVTVQRRIVHKQIHACWKGLQKQSEARIQGWLHGGGCKLEMMNKECYHAATIYDKPGDVARFLKIAILRK